MWHIVIKYMQNVIQYNSNLIVRGTYTNTHTYNHSTAIIQVNRC